MLLEYHIIFMIISVMLFFTTILLLFVEVDFNRSIAGMIISFLNIIVSYVTGQNFFSVNLYGFNATGTIYNNYIYDYSELGLIFIAIAYVSLVFVFYALYLLWDKPWDETRKLNSNPYIYYKGKP